MFSDKKNIPVYSTPQKYLNPIAKTTEPRKSAEKANQAISRHYSTNEGVHTPKSEGKMVAYTDVMCEGEAKEEYELVKLRRYFDTVVKQLKLQDPIKRMRYIRQREAPITLRDLIDLGAKMGQEVGVFLDRKFLSKKNKKSHKDTCLLLYAGSGKKSSLNNGASIQFPPGEKGRFRIIVHTHPTKSNAARQLKEDLDAADENVEMVVNADGDIFYYKHEQCFNAKTPSGNGYTNDLIELLENKVKFTLDTPITIENIRRILDRMDDPDYVGGEIIGDLPVARVLFGEDEIQVEPPMPLRNITRKSIGEILSCANSCAAKPVKSSAFCQGFFKRNKAVSLSGALPNEVYKTILQR